MWFSSHLLKWYSANKRTLPWRETTDPYTIWISEIILQQTRVEQGLPYFGKFISEFPNIEDLARAKEEEVLNVWQGLGYYSRARNLHHTAKVVSKAGGVFPGNYKEIIKLKGIGTYTAAAISSICFDEPRAVVDGNVYRVLSRFFGIADPIDSGYGRKIFEKQAQKELDKKEPGDYNQAIMEFGALVCTPSNPNCDSCVLNSKCAALKTDMVSSYPIKTKKIKIRDRYFNYIMITGDRGSFYQKRSEKDIWQNMYEPLLIESEKHLDPQEILRSHAWLSIFGKEVGATLVRSRTIQHKLTHQNIKARFWETQIKSSAVPANSKLKEFEYTALKNIPIPRLIEKYLELQE